MPLKRINRDDNTSEWRCYPGIYFAQYILNCRISHEHIQNFLKILKVRKKLKFLCFKGSQESHILPGVAIQQHVTFNFFSHSL